MQTDIKEASFIGQGDELVACGSDDGSVCIYRGDTGQLVTVLEADEDVANCVQVGCTRHVQSLELPCCWCCSKEEARAASMHVATQQTPHINAAWGLRKRHVCVQVGGLLGVRWMRSMPSSIKASTGNVDVGAGRYILN